MPVQSYPENDWFYTKESIRSHGSEIGEQGEPLTGYAAFEQAFINRLSKVTKQNLCIKYGDLMFLNEIRLLGNQQHTGNGEVGSKLADLEKEVGESRQIISDLQRINGGLESAWAETTADNRKLNAELEKIQDEAYKQTLKLRQELDASVTEASKLREETAYLASKPYRYKDMPDWIEQNFSEKLILTQKAKAALKAGEYENIPLLCDAVRCLAVDFNDFADKRITFDEYAIRLKAYGLEHSGDSAESTKNTYISYKPEYPEGSGRYVELRMHLRTNTDKSYEPSGYE